MLDLEDRWGRTPLLLATSNGNKEVTLFNRMTLCHIKAVTLLLKKGASIRIRNKHRETPLHFGARSLMILNS